jgi:hypothetical protein
MIDDGQDLSFIMRFPTTFWATMWHQEFSEMAIAIDPPLKKTPAVDFYYMIEEEGQET